MSDIVIAKELGIRPWEVPSIPRIWVDRVTTMLEADNDRSKRKKP